MPSGPRGETRPAYAVGCAAKVARIATGEVEDERVEPATCQGSGGRARAESLTPEERSPIARKAAAARWGASRKKHMSLGPTALNVPEGTLYWTARTVERVEYGKDADGAFIVLQFMAPLTVKATGIRAHVTRELDNRISN